MPQKSRTSVKDRDAFEYWLSSIDDYLDDLKSSVPSEVGIKLDLSAESLDVLEGWILQRFASTDDMVKVENKRLLNAIASYIGETFRRSKGGRWTIYVDDPKFAYDKLPVVIKDGSDPECPLSVATASAARRTGTFLRSVLKAW